MFSESAQADAADSRQKGGTDLGLAIRRELVKRMHRQIGFSSSSAAQVLSFAYPRPRFSRPLAITAFTTFA
ncbi:MAG: hypothetical protein K2X80_20335 [Pseudomonadaceae bacterium]|nr:hypothetical protein [Pseudomonadaceae bacterium]